MMYSPNFYTKSIISTGVFVFAFLTGCDNDLLNTVPEDRLSSEIYWETEEDARLAVNALYRHLPGEYTTNLDEMTDIAIPNNVFNPEKDYVRGTNDALNPVGSNLWSGGYEGIRATNEFLANVGQIDTENQALIDRFKAEARTIRAFEYLRLIMIFGDVPLMTEPISIEESKTIERTDKEQIWNFIETEFQESAAALPETYSPEEVGRITKGAALALKARAMLYAGRYGLAYEAARQVMDLNIYGLYPSYEDLFSYDAENNVEVILDRQYISELDPNGMFGGSGLSALGQGNADNYPVPTRKMVDAYGMSNGMQIDESGSGYNPRDPYENRDPRLRFSMFVLGDTLANGSIYDPRPGFGGVNDINKGQASTNTGFDVRKYINPQDLQQPYNCGINIILIRYAEILLTYAEAKIEAGEIDQSVYDSINEIRGRPDVNMPPLVNSGQSQTEMREIVRHERMVELAFEGQRFYDIRRWEIAEDVMTGPIEGITYEDANGNLETYIYPDYQRNFNAPKHYLWAIPSKELELNPNLLQNTGY